MYDRHKKEKLMLVTTFFDQMRDCGYLKIDEKLTWKNIFDAATDIGSRT